MAFIKIIHNSSLNFNSKLINYEFRRLFSQIQSNNHYDIIIAGGGMVGIALASALGKNSKLNNKRILLLEGAKERQFSLPEKYSNRVVSLNPGTRKIFEEIGAWEFIEKARFSTVKQLQVWDGISDAKITFENENCDNISYIVENDVILNAVEKVAKEISNVKLQYESRIKSIHLPEFAENCSVICLENEDKLTCNLLLGCDGANSQVRKAMGVNYLNWSYDQMGIVATLHLENDECAGENCTAWQRFLPTGPVALLPLTNELSSLVWSTTTEDAKKLLKMPENDFVDAINNANYCNFDHPCIVDDVTKGFNNVLRFLNLPSSIERQLPPKVKSCEPGSRAAFPLGFGHATTYIGKGVALVGDAAHRVHPLAGQGVNLGFGDVACLNKVLGKAAYDGSNIDSLNYLKDYESERQKANVPVMMAIDSLKRLYNTNFTPLVILRSLGLQAVNSLVPLKKTIISQAST